MGIEYVSIMNMKTFLNCPVMFDGFQDMRLIMGSLHEDLCRIALHETLSPPKRFPNPSSMLKGFHDVTFGALNCTKPSSPPEGFSNRSSMPEGFHDMSLAISMRGLQYILRIELHATLSPPEGLSNSASMSEGLHDYGLRHERSAT